MQLLQSKGTDDLKAAGEAPALVSYLTMAMKLSPNLERACGFAVRLLKGRMGDDLKRKISEGNLRLYSGTSEALSKFAKGWGKTCPELERAVHLVQSSASEREPSNRARTLDRALDLALEGARERLRKFSASIHTPTLLLYCMGVLMPMILVGILPVLSVTGGGIGLPQIVVLYCVVIPLLVYMLSRQILSKRPSSLDPPSVNVDEYSPKAILVSIAVAIPFVILACIFRASPEIAGLAVLWSVALAVSAYFHMTSARAFRSWTETTKMEDELPDALVQLGNRIGEGRPAEEAFEQFARTTGEKGLGSVFREAAANVRLGGMGLRASLFDESRGALAHVHSDMISGILRMLVDFMERSTKAAGDAMLQTAEHLRKLGEVRAEMKRMMGEIVSSMRSVALFFAPLIASVTAKMQGVLASKTASSAFLGSEIPPAAFLIVLGVYILILAVLLTNYVVEIEFGEDRVAKRVAIANALPVALGVFTAGAVIGGQALSSLVG